MINAVGLPYSTVRAFVMKRNANGTLIYNKATGYEDRELKDLGVGNSPYLMGLSNTFSYKKFSMTVDIDSKFGAVGYSNLMQYATRFGLTPVTLPGRDNPAGLTVTGVLIFAMIKYNQIPNIYGTIGIILIIVGVVMVNYLGKLN